MDTDFILHDVLACIYLFGLSCTRIFAVWNYSQGEVKHIEGIYEFEVLG